MCSTRDFTPACCLTMTRVCRGLCVVSVRVVAEESTRSTINNTLCINHLLLARYIKHIRIDDSDNDEECCL